MSSFLQDKSHKAIIETIKEYLEQQGYQKTLSVLETEKVSEPSSALSLLINAMDKGDSEAFFTLWNANIQDTSNFDIKTLEFFIRVFFTIYPCHQINGRQALKESSSSKYKSNMEEFKQYLDTQGSNFSKSEEVLSYFALPYIPNLMDHPAFKNIFKVKWLNSLKEKLGAYFGKKPSTNPCILQLMYEKYIEADKYSNTAPDKQLLSQIHSLENQLAIANEEKAKVKEKLHKLEEYSEEYTNGLLLVAKDLYKTIESAKQGKNITDAVVSSAYSSLSKYDNNLTLSVLKDSKPVLLNFASIIKDLTSLQDDLQICALLQALRWRLTRSTRAFRKENLENFIRFNILCTIKPHDTLIDNLLLSTRRVKEFTIRLLNVITSEKTGRAYLLQKENIVSLLVETLYSEKQDNLLRQNSLGVLQKLSLKKTAQIEMIKLDVLDWLLKILKHDTDRIADYTLEYATALLMNLSLRTLGKDKLARNPNDVINMLNKFIAHENNQVRTYINGTLYSILTRKTLKDAALRLNIEKKLKSLRNKSEDNIKRQISFILEQLKSDDNECPTDDTEEEIEENLESESEDEEIIPDDEDMDDVLNIPNLLIGEELLKEKYEKNKSLSAASSKRELEESKEIVRVKRPESNRNKNTSKVTPAKDSSDYSKGFISRDKIPRTPLQF